MWKVISCPYLVHIIGFIDELQNHIIIMEFLKFGNLKEFNKNFMMHCDCWARKLKMMEQIALAMNYLHTLESPIYHGDLKLENIFVDQGFKVKVS